MAVYGYVRVSPQRAAGEHVYRKAVPLFVLEFRQAQRVSPALCNYSGSIYDVTPERLSPVETYGRNAKTFEQTTCFFRLGPV